MSIDVVTDFQKLINSNTEKSIKVLKEIFQKVDEKNSFYKEINKYYTGIHIMFQYLDKDEKQEKLLDNILMDFCSLMNCVALRDKKLIYFLYRNIIECILRYISKDYTSKDLEKLFLHINNADDTLAKNILEKYKAQIKYIYTEACRYIHADISKMPLDVINMGVYYEHTKNDSLSQELKYFKELSILIISIIRAKYVANYNNLKPNSKAYISDILPLNNRIELNSIVQK